MGEVKIDKLEISFSANMLDTNLYVIEQKTIEETNVGPKIVRITENIDAETYVNHHGELDKAIVHYGQEIEDSKKRVEQKQKEIEVLRMKLAEMDKFYKNAKLHMEVIKKEQERAGKPAEAQD